MSPTFLRTAVAILWLTCLDITTATLLLSSLQPISGFPDACTQAYQTPISACSDASNFIHPSQSPCTKDCFFALVSAGTSIQQSCQQQSANSGTVIGQAFIGDLGPWLCNGGDTGSGIVASTSTASNAMAATASASNTATSSTSSVAATTSTKTSSSSIASAASISSSSVSKTAASSSTTTTESSTSSSTSSKTSSSSSTLMSTLSSSSHSISSSTTSRASVTPSSSSKSSSSTTAKASTTSIDSTPFDQIVSGASTAVTGPCTGLQFLFCSLLSLELILFGF